MQSIIQEHFLDTLVDQMTLTKEALTDQVNEYFRQYHHGQYQFDYLDITVDQHFGESTDVAALLVADVRELSAPIFLSMIVPNMKMFLAPDAASQQRQLRRATGLFVQVWHHIRYVESSHACYRLRDDEAPSLDVTLATAAEATLHLHRLVFEASSYGAEELVTSET